MRLPVKHSAQKLTTGQPSTYLVSSNQVSLNPVMIACLVEYPMTGTFVSYNFRRNVMVISCRYSYLLFEEH